METQERQMKLAELAVLEYFDSERRRAGHDYGAGQRIREIRRYRRELETMGELPIGYGLAIESTSEVTTDELASAFERVARPKIARIEAEDYRRSTPATKRTLGTWRRVGGEISRRERLRDLDAV